MVCSRCTLLTCRCYATRVVNESSWRNWICREPVKRVTKIVETAQIFCFIVSAMARAVWSRGSLFVNHLFFLRLFFCFYVCCRFEVYPGRNTGGLYHFFFFFFFLTETLWFRSVILVSKTFYRSTVLLWKKRGEKISLIYSDQFPTFLEKKKTNFTRLVGILSDVFFHSKFSSLIKRKENESLVQV